MTALPYKVECKSDRPYFELIAAFDCEPPAIAYAKECADTSPRSFNRTYRVKRGKNVVATFEPTKGF